jgi:hypothetical protein
MTEFQRLQHLVRLLADMTEEQRRPLLISSTQSDGLPQKMLAKPRPAAPPRNTSSRSTP